MLTRFRPVGQHHWVQPTDAAGARSLGVPVAGRVATATVTADAAAAAAAARPCHLAVPPPQPRAPAADIDEREHKQQKLLQTAPCERDY